MKGVLTMTYMKKFGEFAVKEGNTVLKWFKDREKAVDCFNWYAEAPEELENTLRLVCLRTGEILMECQPE